MTIDWGALRPDIGKDFDQAHGDSVDANEDGTNTRRLELRGRFLLRRPPFSIFGEVERLETRRKEG